MLSGGNAKQLHTIMNKKLNIGDKVTSIVTKSSSLKQNLRQENQGQNQCGFYRNVKAALL